MIRKTLIFHHALVDQVKAKYQETHEERQKQAFSRLFTGNIVKKYRLQKTVHPCLQGSLQTPLNSQLITSQSHLTTNPVVYFVPLASLCCMFLG